MDEKTLCEIKVTGTYNQEWQGSVYFPDSGESRTFQSLLEMIRVVEQMETAGLKGWDSE